MGRRILIVAMVTLMLTAGAVTARAVGDIDWQRDCFGSLQIEPLQEGASVTCYSGLLASPTSQASASPLPTATPLPPTETPPPTETDSPEPTIDPDTHAVPGRIQLEDYRSGGEGVGYHDTTPGNSGGEYRDDDVDIETCLGDSCFNIGWIEAEEWLAYDFHVDAEGDYSFTFRFATPDQGRSLHIELDGSITSDPVALPATGGWHTWQELTGPTFHLTEGNHQLKVVADTSRFNLDWLDVVTAPASSPTPEPALPTPTPDASPTPVVLSGAECPDHIHEQYTVIGPDGDQYRTWHPQVNSATGCFFAHDHGDDPRSSNVNSELPAFGYIGALAGFDEPHNGFKVFVANRGENSEGSTMQVDSRIVFHMGTGGPGRFSRRFHSLQYDMSSSSGHFVHIQGMADTGDVGSICSRNASKPNRTVTLIPGTCDVDSMYEIWSIAFRIRNETSSRATVNVSTAVFEPITLMDPNDLDAYVSSADHFPLGAPHVSCDREAYHGPIYWRNGGGPTEYRTDPYGNIDPEGMFVQEVSAHNQIGIPFSSSGSTLFKLRTNHCAPGLAAPN